MLRSYLSMAARQLGRHPGYTLLTVGGLALGLAACLVIALFVEDELGFDGHVPDAERVVRVVEAFQTPEGEQYRGSTMMPLGGALRDRLAGVEDAVSVMDRSATGRFAVEFGANQFYEGMHLFVEPNMPDFFGLEWQSARPDDALARPNTVVLTQESVDRYFGAVDPIGKTLSAEEYGDFEVVGVLKALPPNSHLKFSMLFSQSTLRSNANWTSYLSSWDTQEMITYLRLAEGFDLDELSAAAPEVIGTLVDQEVLAGRRVLFQPLEDVHFGSGHIILERNASESDSAYVWLFSAIALFVLALACINYMNLATARSMRRAKEIGVRKANGASRNQLARQFLGESMLTSVLALVTALVVVSAFLGPIGRMAGKDLSIALGADWPLLAALVGLALLTGLAAGVYPALYLSRFRAGEVLRGGGSAGGATTLRRMLVGFQFGVSVALISATLIVYQQMQFIQETKLSAASSELLIVDINDGGVRRNFDRVRSDFASVSGVEAVAVSNNIPGDWKNIPTIEVAIAGGNGAITSAFLGVDEAFLDVYQIALVSGRPFSRQFAADSTSVILNETAARALGVGVGDQIRIPGTELSRRYQSTAFEPTVIAIAEDFHIESLRSQIPPVVIGYRTNPVDVIDYFTIKVAGGVTPGILAQLSEKAAAHDPEHPFEYNFLDERLRDFYVSEIRAARLFSAGSLLAVIIACLGLFGLSAFMAERRTKEIGIRKVLGASIPGLVGLLSGGVLRMVGVAGLAAVPLVYLGMDRWLSNFVYRVQPDWWIFLVACLATLSVSMVTIGYHAIRAARTDPAKNLRYE